MSSTATNNSCIVYGTGCSSSTNLPSYIDDRACLCGLLESRSSLPNNGEYIELWRCIGDASDDIEDGGHGKWYNTSLPSQELAGLNKPQNWGENPPDLSQAYVLLENHGQAAYEKLGSEGSGSLIGSDRDCTGKNDTSMSRQYYAKGEGAPKPATTSASSTSSTSSTLSTTSTSSTSVTASANSVTETSGTASTTASTSPSEAAAPPKGESKSSGKAPISLKATILVGIVLAPMFGLVV